MRFWNVCAALVALLPSVVSAQFWGAGHAPFMPLDNLPQPTICFSTKRLLSSYTANKALDVTVVSTPTTIGFVNNSVDVASANAACGSNLCYITKWYDQCGLGADASQSIANGGGNPTINPPLWNGASSIAGQNPVIFTTDNVADRSNVLTSNVFKSNAVNPLTIFMVGQPLRSLQNSWLYQDVQFNIPIANAPSTSGPPGIGISGVASTTTPAEVNPSVLVVQVQGGTMTAWSNDQTSSVSASPTAVATVGGAYFGASGGGGAVSASFDTVAYLVYQSALTTAQINTIRASLASTFGITTSFSDVVVQDGDSFTSGKGSTYDDSILRCAITGCQGVASVLKRQVRAYNNSVDGLTCAQVNSNFSTNVPTYYQAGYRSFTYTVLAGANDIRASTPVATIYACLQSIVNKVHALGANAKVVVTSQPVQCDIFQNGTELAALQALNNLIFANWNVPQASGGLGADGLNDLFDVPTVGPGNYTTTPVFCGSPNQYSPDGQHPTDLSMSLFGPTEGAALNARLP